MHRSSGQRGADVLAHKAAVARQLLDRAVCIDRAVGHLAPPLGGKDKHRADAAVHVDQVVLLGRAGVKAQVIEVLFVGVQMLR